MDNIKGPDSVGQSHSKAFLGASFPGSNGVKIPNATIVVK